MTGLATICLLFALGKERWLSNDGLAFSICATAYIIVCPFYPPSLIALIRTNAAKTLSRTTMAAGSISFAVSPV